MKKRTLLLLLLILGFNALDAQDFNTVLNKATSKYLNTENYSIDAIYNMYSDSISKTRIDQQKASLFKNGSNYYLKMADAEIIATDSFFIKISHSEKMMLYSKMNRFKKETYKNTQLPFMDYISEFKNKIIKDKGDFWECILSDNQSISIPYKKIVLQVSKSDYVIKKQVYFFNRSIEKQFNTESKKYSNERLEIITSKFNSNPKNFEDKFVFEKYLTKTRNSLTSSAYTKNYKIIVQ